MKKLLTILTLCLLLVTATASAEKFRYKDPEFDFKDRTKMQLLDIAILESTGQDYVPDDGVDQKIRLQLRSALAEKKVRLQVEAAPSAAGPGKVGSPGAEPAGAATTLENQGSILRTEKNLLQSPLQITVKIYRLGYERYYRGPWTQTTETTKSIVVKDREGRDKTIYVPETVVTNHPEGYYYNAFADIEFNVVDPKSGQTVYSLHDSRTRGGETDTDGMLKRICNDFVEDVTKNGK